MTTADAKKDAAESSFQIAAIDLRMLLKRLKPAFPRGRAINGAVAEFHVTTESLSVVLPGGRVGTVVSSYTSFVATIPFSEFAWIGKETLRDGENLTFTFAPGRMTFRGVTISHPLVRVRSGEHEAVVAPEPSGSIGLPLAAAYQELRKYPPGTFQGNAHLQAAEAEIDAILRTVDKLLKPLGIGRTDVESLLNNRS